MKYKLAWSGLADANYWEMIAKYCVPSWKTLPGPKFIIHDRDSIKLKGFTIVNWNDAHNPNSTFLTLTDKNKPLNFWRKMRSQVWAVENLREYDFVVLLDTDVEIIGFDESKFEKILDELLEKNLVWATGESQRRGLDAGHIVINMKHSDVDKLFTEYENVWESGEILTLDKWYDGHVVQNLLLKYQSVKIKNRDYGSGLHIYDIGTVHWGSKLPKQMRSEWTGDGKSLVEKRLSEIQIKKYKNDTRETT